jgi:hypothetical protein
LFAKLQQKARDSRTVFNFGKLANTIWDLSTPTNDLKCLGFGEENGG